MAEWSDFLRYANGNFYVNDKSTGSVVGQQPFGGARKSGIFHNSSMVIRDFIFYNNLHNNNRCINWYFLSFSSCPPPNSKGTTHSEWIKVFNLVIPNRWDSFYIIIFTLKITLTVKHFMFQERMIRLVARITYWNLWALWRSRQTAPQSHSGNMITWSSNDYIFLRIFQLKNRNVFDS